MTRVLVIDDEAPIRLLCRVNLEAEGMEVEEASGGELGLELARTESFDAIVLDVMMPGLDGWSVAERLADDPRTSAVPILFLTARVEIRDRVRALDLAGVDYVTKPFNPLALAGLVRDLLEASGKLGAPADRRRGLAALRGLLAEG
ncbi:MAG: response regulator [Actinobacteria bacterium]|nr:response regulator [Actinomycetota bacterium]